MVSSGSTLAPFLGGSERRDAAYLTTNPYKPMRLLFVNKLYPPDIGGGAEVTLSSLARGAQARGVEVLVATTTAGRDIVRDVVDGVRVIRLPLHNIYWHHEKTRRSALARMAWHLRDAHNRSMGEQLAAVADDFRPDIVSFHNIAGFSAAAWAAPLRSGARTVQVLHDYYNLCAKSQMYDGADNCDRPCTSCRMLRAGRDRTSNQLTAVVGVSAAVLGRHVQNGLFSAVPIKCVVHNARTIAPAGRGRQSQQARTFGFIGTLAPWKGVQDALDAFQSVAASPQSPPLRMVIAGEGEPHYVAELHERYAAPNIEFVGRVQPETFFAGIDVSIVPSRWHDPLPGVVFESLLCGVPVIGALRGGIPEMVTHRANGLLYEPSDPKGLSEALALMVSAEGLFRQCQAAASASAARFADVGRMVSEHLAVYKEVSVK